MTERTKSCAWWLSIRVSTVAMPLRALNRKDLSTATALITLRRKITILVYCIVFATHPWQYPLHYIVNATR